MELTEEAVATWLRQLPDKRFYEVLTSAAKGRGPDKHDVTWLQSHVVFGLASREREKAAGWSVELIGMPDPPVVGGDDSLAEAGEHCGFRLTSWAKVFKCPICGETTHGT